MLPKARSSETLLSIQALRAVAALGVLVLHIVGEISDRLGMLETSLDVRIGVPASISFLLSPDL
jgi:peptidoglycan/LPS O-acetylase OafA/YrhL